MARYQVVTDCIVTKLITVEVAAGNDPADSKQWGEVIDERELECELCGIVNVYGRRVTDGISVRERYGKLRSKGNGTADPQQLEVSLGIDESNHEEPARKKRPSKKDSDRLLTLKECQKITNLSDTTLTRMRNRGEFLQPVKVGNRKRFVEGEVYTWLENYSRSHRTEDDIAF